MPSFPNQQSFRRVEPVRPEFIQAAASSIPHNSPSPFTNPLYFSRMGFGGNARLDEVTDSASGTLVENEPMLNRQQIQHPIHFETIGFDFRADLI